MRNIVCGVMCGIVIAGMAASAPEAAERTFHVSPAGNDSWKGTSDRPFASVAKARDTVRGLVRRGLDTPVTVIVHGGLYELGEPVVFTPADSGTETCPVTYRAAAGETPVISGGRRITGPWKRYRDGIMVLSIPEARDGAWYFRQLFRNGERQVRARRASVGER